MGRPTSRDGYGAHVPNMALRRHYKLRSDKRNWDFEQDFDGAEEYVEDDERDKSAYKQLDDSSDTATGAATAINITEP